MDEKRLLEEIKKNEKLAENKEFMLKAVKLSSNILKYASKELKDDKEIVMEAVKKDSIAFVYASDRLKNDKDVVFEAIKGVKELDEILKGTSFDLKLDERKMTFNEKMNEELEKIRKEVIKILAKVLIAFSKAKEEISKAKDEILKEAEKINSLEKNFVEKSEVRETDKIFQDDNQKNEVKEKNIDEIFDEIMENPNSIDKYVDEKIIDTKFIETKEKMAEKTDENER